MQTEQLTKVVSGFVAGIPVEVTEKLEDVEVLIYDTVAHADQGLEEEFEDSVMKLPVDCKGVFIGEPMEIEEGSDEEDAEFPEGVIALVASHIETPEEGIVVLCHEIGHALGLDEDGVKALGLGMKQPEAPAAAAPAAEKKASEAPADK